MIETIDEKIREIIDTAVYFSDDIKQGNNNPLNRAVEEIKSLIDEEFYQTFEEVGKVYCHFTNSKLSKPNYLASVVIAEIEDIQSEYIEDNFISKEEVADGYVSKEECLKKEMDAHRATTEQLSKAGLYTKEEVGRDYIRKDMVNAK